MREKDQLIQPHLLDAYLFDQQPHFQLFLIQLLLIKSQLP